MKGKPNEKKLKRALLQRALGFYGEDISEEYETGDEGERMVKRKINRKFYPPDLSAVRELLGKVEPASAETMSDEDLERERERLLAELREELK